jgi:hypothetical protein
MSANSRGGAEARRVPFVVKHGDWVYHFGVWDNEFSRWVLPPTLSEQNAKVAWEVMKIGFLRASAPPRELESGA